MPGRVLAEQLGGGGRDDDEVGALAEPRVRDRLGPAEQRRARRLRRERRERERADEALRVVGEHRRDVDAGVDEPAADLDRLVRGDPAADTEYDPGHRTLRLGSGDSLRPALGQADASGVASTISTATSSAARLRARLDALVRRSC